MTDFVYNRIAKLRAERGTSGRQISGALGVHYQTIGYLDRGEYKPKPATGSQDRRVLPDADGGGVLH